MSTMRFLVPLDLGTQTDAVLKVALTLAQKAQAGLILLHVRDETTLNPWAYTAQAEADVHRALEHLLARVQAAGLDGECVLVHGVPWREILLMAKTRQADLIVMGTHGRRGVSRVLLGSVAEQVLRHGLCPVLVCHPQDTEVGVEPQQSDGDN
jgi:nucleotide-binding universal stress UspA family protein